MASTPPVDPTPDSPPGDMPADAPDSPPHNPVVTKTEIAGRNGPEPTRYGDWENKGICVDF